MAINKRVIHFKTKKKFQEALDNGDILSTSIVFIKDTLELYTHEQLYSFADREAFDELVNKVSNLSDQVIEDILGEQANNANEVGAAVLVNKSTLRKIIVRPDKITDYSPEAYEPIGVVAIPASHDVYGTGECGVVALMSASCETPDTGSNSVQTVYFGRAGRVGELTYYSDLSTMRINNINIELRSNEFNGYLPTDCSGMQGPSSLDGFSRYKYPDTTFVPSPYNFDGSKNPIYHNPGNTGGDNIQYINSLNPIYGQPIKTSDNLIISWETYTNLWNKFPNSDAYDGKQWTLSTPNNLGSSAIKCKIKGGPGKIIFKCRVNGSLDPAENFNELMFGSLDGSAPTSAAGKIHIDLQNRNQWFYINYDIPDSSEHHIYIFYDYSSSSYPNIDSIDIYVAREGFVQYIPGGTPASSNALSDFNGKYNTQTLCSKATAQADWKTSMGTPAVEEVRETVITAEGFNIRWETQTGEWVQSENSDSYDSKTFTSVSPGDYGETRLRCIVSGKAGKLVVKYMSDAEGRFDYLVVGKLDLIPRREDNGDGEYYYENYKDSTAGKQNQWFATVYDIPDENEHFIEFCYTKDESGSEGQDHAQVYIAFQGEIILSPAKPATPAIINSNDVGYYPAACCCWRYHTLGTNQGDWYLPALGELGYCFVTLKKIQNTIQYLQNHFNKKYSYICDFVGTDDYDGSTPSNFVSSSLRLVDHVTYLEVGYGYIDFHMGSTSLYGYSELYSTAHPFLRLKLEQENKINMSTINQALTKHINSKRHIPEGGNDKQILIWKADGEARWEHLVNIFSNLEDTFAYGVEWNVNVADPHLTRIGNMSFHKTLPIQSQLKGCIAQGNKIMYWLDENDWRFRKDGTIIAVDLTSNTNTFKVPSVEGLGINQYLRSGENLARITAIDAGASTITVEWKVAEGADSANLSTIDFLEIGSRLDGYDGTVRVYCPSFYIKSEIIGDIRRVWLSTMKIDNTWTHQPEILVDAYKCTVLNTVPENMGYLSTLPVNSAISVVNTSAYCRGGYNNTAYDKYLETDPYRTSLGKPRTNITRSDMRIYTRNASSEILSYDQYKNIFYWLYVVEYANFNCQEAYNAELTAEGYHQGGMGEGVTNWSYSNAVNYNYYCPLTPCGYTNEFGNKTGVKSFTTVAGTDNLDAGTTSIPAITSVVPRWRGFENPFGDILTIPDGIIIQENAEGPRTIYTTTDPNNYGDNEAAMNAMEIAGYEIDGRGYIKEFDLGEAAHIIPKSVGGDTTKYKCDYHSCQPNGPCRLVVFMGGTSYDSYGGMNAGLCAFHSGDDVSNCGPEMGYWTVSTSVSFPESE